MPQVSVRLRVELNIEIIHRNFGWIAGLSLFRCFLLTFSIANQFIDLIVIFTVLLLIISIDIYWYVYMLRVSTPTAIGRAILLCVRWLLFLLVFVLFAIIGFLVRGILLIGSFLLAFIIVAIIIIARILLPTLFIRRIRRVIDIRGALDIDEVLVCVRQVHLEDEKKRLTAQMACYKGGEKDAFAALVADPTVATVHDHGV